MENAIKPRFLLDTDMCICVLAGQPAPVKARIESLRPGEIAISAIALAEFAIGARRSGIETAADRLVRRLAILPFDEAAARVYAQLPFRRGRFDRLIAAHAVSTGLVLVSNNERDYRDIPGLQLENWARA